LYQETSAVFGNHNTDNSKLKIDDSIRRAVAREVSNRMKSGHTLCERLCDIVKNKMAVKKLKNESPKK
jgi:hypothetical protein